MAQIGNQFTRIASSVCSPSIVPEIKLVWKRQLSCCHLKTLPPLPITLRKRCISAVTSLLLQGIPPCSLHALRSRAYSFAEHGYTKTVTAQMGDSVTDTSLPNETWSPEAVELYKKLTTDLIEQGNGDWVQHRTSLYHGEKRLFTKAVILELPGKFFEYQLFCSAKEQRVKGVIQFGPYTQGPPGYVHGGASAAIMDDAIGVCVNKSFSHCVTATLTTNYKSPLPLGTTALVESWVDKVDGRKIFGAAELKSPDTNTTYVTANALFIQLDLQGKDKGLADKNN